MCRLSVTARQSMSALTPNRRVKEIIVLLTITLVLFTHCLTINKLGHPDIVAKTRVDLQPIVINAFLYDLIRISAPVINERAVYYLHKPNGDAMKLDINSPKLREIKDEQDVQRIVTRFVNYMKPVAQVNNEVFTIRDMFDNKLEDMEDSDFMIGPISAEDHGNWVLSVYMKDFDDNWIELFQVISVTITEYVPLTPSKPSLSLGDTLNLSIAFPIPDLESCELVAPRSTFDRFYGRDRIDLSTCGFIVPNVTLKDAGIWRILAVGKIVYEGEITLDINVGE